MRRLVSITVVWAAVATLALVTDAFLLISSAGARPNDQVFIALSCVQRDGDVTAVSFFQQKANRANELEPYLDENDVRMQIHLHGNPQAPDRWKDVFTKAGGEGRLRYTSEGLKFDMVRVRRLGGVASLGWPVGACSW